MAYIRQSRPDSGPGVQVKVNNNKQGVPLRSESGGSGYDLYRVRDRPAVRKGIPGSGGLVFGGWGLGFRVSSLGFGVWI